MDFLLVFTVIFFKPIVVVVIMDFHTMDFQKYLKKGRWVGAPEFDRKSAAPIPPLEQDMDGIRPARVVITVSLPGYTVRPLPFFSR